MSAVRWSTTRWAIKDTDGRQLAWVTEAGDRYLLGVEDGSRRAWFPSLAQAMNAAELYLSGRLELPVGAP